MEVAKSNMLFILVGVMFMTGNGRAGYIYPRPNIAFELPKNGQNFQGALSQTAQENNFQESYETVVTYSIPANNYQHLNQPNALRPESFSVPGNVPNIPLPISQQNNIEVNPVQHVIHENIDNNLNFPTALNVQNIVQPKITKHIYFHVPPPEIEEPPTLPVPTKKKIYKIIFIKLPSQESKNVAELQRLALNQAAPIEDKTIIYVLSKKPEPPQVILPKPVPSEHEVLFVKYSGNAGEAVQQITDEVVQSDLPTPTLQPGLINGKR